MLPRTCSSCLTSAAFMLMRHTAQAGGSVTQGLSSCHNATQRLYYREGSASSPTFSATHLTAKDYILQWAERTGECTSRNLSVADCTNAWRQAVFSFAIVRNPFDRQVSIFHSLIEHECAPSRHSRHSPSRQCSTRRFPFVENTWSQSVDNQVIEFRHWIQRLDSAYPVGSIRNSFFTSMVAADRRNDASQFAWVEDTSGRLAVSRVLKYEASLQHAFAQLVHECLPGCGLALPHTAASEGRLSSPRHYSDYYDDETESIVRRQTIRDFAAFGYEERLDRSS